MACEFELIVVCMKMSFVHMLYINHGKTVRINDFASNGKTSSTYFYILLELTKYDHEYVG